MLIDVLPYARLPRLPQTQFASEHYVSCAQLQQLLRLLPAPRDCLHLLCCCWARVTDRAGLAGVVGGLSGSQQAALAQRLGHLHVWESVGRQPQGLHFHLDLQDPEQKEVAKEVGASLPSGGCPHTRMSACVFTALVALLCGWQGHGRGSGGYSALARPTGSGSALAAFKSVSLLGQNQATPDGVPSSHCRWCGWRRVRPPKLQSQLARLGVPGSCATCSAMHPAAAVVVLQL